jgi:UDP-glucose 4-epimerase
MYNLDYRVIRLANPFGPYQRPNGKLGAVTTFTYKAIKHEPITLYGDGSVIRDFIYIDDAINAILLIAKGDSYYKVFNVGSGKGTSIKELLDIIDDTLQTKLIIHQCEGRKADVPKNYLDISRYESIYGTLNKHTLREGILLTKKFLEENY